MNEPTPSILDLTLRSFRRAFGMYSHDSTPLTDGLDPALPETDAGRVRRQIDHCLEARGGEVSARGRAAGLGEAYLALDSGGRRRFLELLAREYDLDADRVNEAIHAREQAQDRVSQRRTEAELRDVLVPPRIKLLRQFNGLSQGVKFLVDMRAELLSFASDDPELRAFDTDLHRLLTSWFDVGFLELRRITWDTSAALLEKLIEYEAVHAIRSWEDLKHRLEADRRCFAFFHPNMPGEPLIFVQVALVDGMSNSVQSLLDENAPMGAAEDANAAIFYSISNCQDGLAGVGFGNFLIKRVVSDLVHDLPNLKTFATLSPIPGFRGWLARAMLDADSKLLSDSESATVAAVTGTTGNAERALATVLEQTGWQDDEKTEAAMRPILLRLCARYLLNERRGVGALDRVAHFHLSNGARIERINWLADTSDKGMAQSAGMMVNYCYVLDKIEQHHESYTGNGKVASNAAVRKLLKG